MDPNAAEPVNPGGAAAPSNPLANLEGVVAAAQQEVAAAQPIPVQTAAEKQFANQFGETATPTPAESAPDLMGQALANLEPANNSQPAPEVTLIPQPEEAPLDPRQKFINTVATAYEELKAAG